MLFELSKMSHMKFNIELDTHGVPDAIPQLAKLVMDDRESTLRERQLAWAIIELANAVNRLVEQLNYGAATVVVEESSIRYGKIE